MKRLIKLIKAVIDRDNEMERLKQTHRHLDKLN